MSSACRSESNPLLALQHDHELMSQLACIHMDLGLRLDAPRMSTSNVICAGAPLSCTYARLNNGYCWDVLTAQGT